MFKSFKPIMDDKKSLREYIQTYKSLIVLNDDIHLNVSQIIKNNKQLVSLDSTLILLRNHCSNLNKFIHNILFICRQNTYAKNRNVNVEQYEQELAGLLLKMDSNTSDFLNLLLKFEKDNYDEYLEYLSTIKDENTNKKDENTNEEIISSFYHYIKLTTINNMYISISKYLESVDVFLMRFEQYYKVHHDVMLNLFVSEVKSY